MGAFRFNPRPEVTEKVTLSVPTEKGFEKQTFTARFLLLPDDERSVIAEDPKAAMRRVWLGWNDVLDGDGKPIPFTEAVRDEMLEYQYVMFGLSQAYARISMGIEAKN